MAKMRIVQSERDIWILQKNSTNKLLIWTKNYNRERNRLHRLKHDSEHINANVTGRLFTPPGNCPLGNMNQQTGAQNPNGANQCVNGWQRFQLSAEPFDSITGIPFFPSPCHENTDCRQGLRAGPGDDIRYNFVFGRDEFGLQSPELRDPISIRWSRYWFLILGSSNGRIISWPPVRELRLSRPRRYRILFGLLHRFLDRWAISPNPEYA